MSVLQLVTLIVAKFDFPYVKVSNKLPKYPPSNFILWPVKMSVESIDFEANEGYLLKTV